MRNVDVIMQCNNVLTTTLSLDGARRPAETPRHRASTLPFLALAIAVGATLGSACSNEAPEADDYPEISAQDLVLVIEPGAVAPALAVHGARDASFGASGAAAPAVGGTDRGGSFEIRGAARFAETHASRATARLRAGALELPAISAPDDVGDSYVQLVVGDQRIGQPLLVAARPKGTIAQITNFVPAGDRSYVALGADYALVDVNAYQANASDRGQAGSPQRGEDPSQAPGGSTTSGLCIRTPFGPGWVEWQWVDPWSFGYSVKPETSNSLVYGHLPSEGCDGIYNLAWGCGLALKIPDHCTFYAGDGSYCCNAATIPLFGVVRWVNPGSGGEATEWPVCPLP
jgi:hypothetical protein